MNEIVFAQTVELVAIVASIQLCLFVFWLWKRFDDFKKLLVPVFLFFVFGAADALVTISNNVFSVREGNPYARVFIEWGGWKGYVFLTVLWVCLWAFAALALLELRAREKNGSKKAFFLFACLAEFYALAVGHAWGFLSWFGVFLFSGGLGEKLACFVFAGALFALVHSAIVFALKRARHV
ncbi:hypothetical protein HY992_06515 [Candidatus Micrarchaeota archaeon]|nr:hypothetical protein [Candidatus Micrarchaeota archaeon]